MFQYPRFRNGVCVTEPINMGSDKLWVSFGIGNTLHISIHFSFVMHLMDKLETPSPDDIAVTESFVILLY